MTTATITILNVTAAKADRYRRAPKGGCTIAGRFYAGGQFIGNLAIDAPAGSPEPAPVVLEIGGSAYEVEGIKAAPEIGTHAFALTKRGTGAGYFVILDNYGEARCDCGDFEFRHAGRGTHCKHISELVDAGLMPARRSPAPTRPARPRRFVPSAEDFREAARMFARA